MEAYPGLTPGTFWALTVDEYAVLREHLNERARQAGIHVQR